MGSAPSVVAGVDAVRVAPRLTHWLALLRVRQWLKNGFVLAGLFFSDRLLDFTSFRQAVLATVAFCLVSSAVYCLNDIVDREADAAHPEKCRRPLACGAVSLAEAKGLLAASLVGCVAVLAVARFPWPVPVVIASYLAMNVAYSGWLKHVTLLDVVVIAAGFVLRLVAGTWAVGVDPTSWIVLCTGLLALFLALGKRRGDLELELAANRNSLSGYSLNYIDQALGMMGAATLVFYSAFTVSGYALHRYGSSLLYLTTFPVAIGILRYLQLVLVMHRYGSPTDIVLSDRALQAIAAIWLALFAVLVYG